MELEIKGFIEFCKFLANYPEDIMNNERLVSLLDFCFSSVPKCNCANEINRDRKETEIKFFAHINALPKDITDLLAQIFDKENKYSAISISFPINDTIIKIK